MKDIKKDFATFSFFVKMNLVKNVQAETPQSEFGYMEAKPFIRNAECSGA